VLHVILFFALAVALVGCGSAQARPTTSPVPQLELGAAPPLPSAVATAELAEERPVIHQPVFNVRVDASAVHGGLDIAEASGVVSFARDSLMRACQRKVSASVKLSLGLTVEPNGKVSRVDPLDAAPDDPLGACVGEQLRRLSFPARERASSVVASVDWIAADQVTHGRTVDEVLSGVAKQKALLRQACEAHVQVGTTRALAHFIITPGGTVSLAEVDSSDTALADCLRRQVLLWTFERADEATPVDLPFLFTK
jgi:hypothetical protein